LESGGLAALGRCVGYPKGNLRIARSRSEFVNRWKTEGLSNREIVRRLGLSEMAIRKVAGARMEAASAPKDVVR
jgi:hypothetical protein